MKYFWFLARSKKQILLGLSLWLTLVLGIVSIPLLPLHSNTKISGDFLKLADNQHALIFFGFTGCSEVCPTTLATISQAIALEPDLQKRPQVYFIDIDIGSSPQRASTYAQQYHHSFVGLHPTEQQLKTMTQNFGLNMQRQNGQLSHLGKTYLVQHQPQGWHLIKSFNPYSFSAASLRQDFL